MTPEEYRAALLRLGVSQVQAAVVFGVDERVARRWAKGDRPIPALVVKILRLMLDGKITIGDLAAD